jgi:methyl-accepting chemotaxis protein
MFGTKLFGPGAAAKTQATHLGNLAVRAIGHMVVPAFVLDGEGRVILWNPAVERLTGVSAASLLGTKDCWNAFYAAQRPCLADLVLKGDSQSTGLYASLANGGAGDGTLSAESWCDLPIGRRMYLALDASPIRDESGKIIAVVETLLDLTAKKNAEQAVISEGEEQVRRLGVIREALGSGLARFADGDLLSRIETPLPDGAEALRTDFNGAIGELQGVLAAIVTSIDAIQSGIGEISHAADDLSRRTEQQAATLEQTAAALDEITATVKKGSGNVKQAREAVAAAKVDAESSGEIVRKANDAMSGIEASSNQIGEIIGVIDEIAFQTNLLALNAGVEAARAGDAGRGFAVVASEVRALAQRSAEAAKEIKALIAASKSQVRQGVDLVGQTSTALGRILTQVGEINLLMSDVAAGAQEQATALDEVNVAVNGIDQVTQQNAAMVEQTTAAARQLGAETEGLSRLISRFKIGETAKVQPLRPRAAKPTPRNLAVVTPMRRGGAALARKPEPLQSDEAWESF